MIDPRFSIGDVLALLGFVATAITGWFKFKNHVERVSDQVAEAASKSTCDQMQKDIDELNRQRTALWNKFNTHEKEASDERLRFTVEIAKTDGELRTLKSAIENHMRTMSSRLEHIEGKLDRVIEQRGA